MGRSRCLAVLMAVGLVLTSGQSFAGCNPNKPAPPVARRFTIKGGTVLDKVTGLTWQRCSVGQKWKEKWVVLAWWIRSISPQPKTKKGDGWRLPSSCRIAPFVAGTLSQPAINEEAFPDMDPSVLWYSGPTTVQLDQLSILVMEKSRLPC